MSNRFSLASHNIIGFVPARDMTRAGAFYGGVLGLRLVSQDSFAAVFDANGIMLRVSAVADLTPAPYTVLGWQVGDIAAAVEELTRSGVVFERYEGMSQDAQAIWVSPGGARIAWFKDPDGNTLSVTEFRTVQQ